MLNLHAAKWLLLGFESYIKKIFKNTAGKADKNPDNVIEQTIENTENRKQGVKELVISVKEQPGQKTTEKGNKDGRNNGIENHLQVLIVKTSLGPEKLIKKLIKKEPVNHQAKQGTENTGPDKSGWIVCKAR